jgi:hypothetical protein
MGPSEPARMARASHMRIAMQNNTNFIAISLENLNTVTGGYHDADPPAPMPIGIGAGAVGSVGGVVGDLLRKCGTSAAPTK